MLEDECYLTPQEIVYRSLGEPRLEKYKPEEELKSERCRMCGKKIKKGYKTKSNFPYSYNFTNNDKLKYPFSQYTCIPCAYSLRGKTPEGKQLIGSSFIATEDKFELLSDNKSIQNAILNPPQKPFVINIGREVRRKHLIFLSEANYDSKSGIYVQYRQNDIFLTPELINLYQMVIKLNNEGFKKTFKKSGNKFRMLYDPFRQIKSNKIRCNILGGEEAEKKYIALIQKYKNTLAYAFIDETSS